MAGNRPPLASVVKPEELADQAAVVAHSAGRRACRLSGGTTECLERLSRSVEENSVQVASAAPVATSQTESSMASRR
jgi:hypothetical protein